MKKLLALYEYLQQKRVKQMSKKMKNLIAEQKEFIKNTEEEIAVMLVEDKYLSDSGYTLRQTFTCLATSRRTLEEMERFFEDCE